MPHLTEPIREARKRLTIIENKELSDIFNEFVAHPNNTKNEVNLCSYLTTLSKKYPEFVYKPFFQLYAQFRDYAVK